MHENVTRETIPTDTDHENLCHKQEQVINYINMEIPNLKESIAKLQMKPEEIISLLHAHGFNLSNIGMDEILSFIDDSDQKVEYGASKANRLLLLYIPPILVLVGTVGNMLSFFVFRTYTNKISTYSYLSALAIMDVFVLQVGLLRLWLAQLTSIDIQDEADWLCKLIAFFGYVTSDSSVWLIIAVTVDRYIAVCHPLKASNMCRLKRARIVVAATILTICVVNVHFIWTVELIQVYSNNSNPVYDCDAGPSFRTLVQDIWPWVDAAIYSFVPFVILIVLNGKIIQQVYLARQERAYLLTKDRPYTKASRHSGEVSRKLTMMLLLVSFTFLLTTLPLNVMLILTAFFNENRKSEKTFANFSLARTVSELLMYVNHTINFFLYCTTGKKFRQQILSLACKCCRYLHKREDSVRTQTIGVSRTKMSLKVTYRNGHKSPTHI